MGPGGASRGTRSPHPPPPIRQRGGPSTAGRRRPSVAHGPDRSPAPARRGGARCRPDRGPSPARARSSPSPATVASAAVRVLVTGGAGFIGSSVCRRLASTPGVDHVIALDDLSTGSTSNLREIEHGAIELRAGSILDAAALGDAARSATAIVHLAARPSVSRSVADPVATHLANATGTVEVLEAARRTGAHVVVASSSSVYGATPTLPKREDLPTRPMSPYAASKLATEAYTNAYAHSFGMATLALRFFNVFGPGQAGRARLRRRRAGVHRRRPRRQAAPDRRRRQADEGLHLRRLGRRGDRRRRRPPGHGPRTGEPRVRHADRPAHAHRPPRSG